MVDTTDKFRLSDLYDIYGDLLTEKQQSLFEAYYYEDLSLREIAEADQVTPQAVRDSLKRSETLLLGYEKKLSLLEQGRARDAKIDNLLTYVIQLDNIDENDKRFLTDSLLEMR